MFFEGFENQFDVLVLYKQCFRKEKYHANFDVRLKSKKSSFKYFWVCNDMRNLRAVDSLVPSIEQNYKHLDTQIMPDGSSSILSKIHVNWTGFTVLIKIGFSVSLIVTSRQLLIANSKDNFVFLQNRTFSENNSQQMFSNQENTKIFFSQQEK